MRWLGPALVSEGPSDDRFLPNVINRAIVEFCARHFVDSVEIADVVVVRERGGPGPIDASVAELRRNAGSFNMVIFHHDAGSDPQRVEREWVEPMRATWSQFGTGDPLLFLVPVRETEAWALTDGDAIRRVYGVSWDDQRLGVPANPRDVRRIADPKKALDTIARAVGGRESSYYSRLGELIDLQKLAAVDAFSNFRDDVLAALENELRLTRQG